MVKLLMLLIKFGPAIWTFTKETIFKLEDRKYFIRNKFQIATILTMILSTFLLYTVYEGYNAHAAESLRKGNEMQKMEKEIAKLNQQVDDLRKQTCPTSIEIDALRELLNKKDNVIENQELEDIDLGQKTQTP